MLMQHLLFNKTGLMRRRQPKKSDCSFGGHSLQKMHNIQGSPLCSGRDVKKKKNFENNFFFLVKCPSIFLNIFEASDTVFLSFFLWRF